MIHVIITGWRGKGRIQTATLELSADDEWLDTFFTNPVYLSLTASRNRGDVFLCACGSTNQYKINLKNKPARSGRHS